MSGIDGIGGGKRLEPNGAAAPAAAPSASASPGAKQGGAGLVDASAQAARNEQTQSAARELGLTGPTGMVRNSGVPTGDAPKNNRPGNTRKKLSAEELQKLQQIPTHLKSIAKPDPESKYGDLLADEGIVRIFQAQYKDVTGVQPVYARDLVQLLRDNGDQLLKMAERPIPIGVVSYSAKKCDELSIKKFVRAMFNALDSAGVLGDVALVGGFTNVGGIRASYAAAEAYPDVETQGIMSPPGLFWEPAQVDKGLVYGAKNWGEESPIFLDLISEGFMVGIGGGAQAAQEASWFISRNSDRAIIAEGFTNTGKDGAELPGAVDGVAGGFRLQDASQDPVAAGTLAGEHIARLARERREQRQTSPLMRLALEASPNQIVEVDQWAKANTSKYRILRIISAVGDKLRDAGVPEKRVTEQLADIGFKLIENTFGIDNFAENAKWQQRAKQALTDVGGDVGAVLDKVAMDIMFASWFGIQEYREKPGFFEENTSKMPMIVTKDDLQKAHTLPAAKYAEIRLDYKTVAYLNAADSTPEVFLGTKEEMELFYRAKGFQFARTLHDSNGSFYYLLTNGDTRMVVIHGVDSEARLAQLSALMVGAGADPSRIVVRGKMENVRQANRNMLELALANLGKPIAGVIIGNKGDATSELAAMAGISPTDLAAEEKMAGSFRFRVIPVQAHGHDATQVVVAFSPAYGELSQDLVDAAITAGARNFMIGGAGGSLIPTDKLGAVHQVVSADYYGSVIDLAKTPNVTLIDIPGATKVKNVFSPAPLEQTVEWAEKARAKGAGDVDQETGPIFVALQEAATKGQKQLNVITGLYQSDVVGTGALAGGTVDTGYAPAVREMAQRFFTALGIAGVETQARQIASIDGSAAGLLAKQKPTGADLAKIEIKLPDLDTIGSSAMESSEKQFKGQKRVIQVRTDAFGSKERQMLRELLRELNPAQFWVTTAQSDQAHGEVLDIAKELGFESILVATKDAVAGDKILGQPTFILKRDDEAGVQATLAEFARDGKNDEYEANSAQHYVLYLGKFKPSSSKKGEIYSSLIDRDDVVDEADKIRREARDAVRKVKSEIKDEFTAKGLNPPTFHAIEELGDFFGKKKPIMVSGASKKSWPQVAPEHQAYTRVLMALLAQTLDKDKQVIVTGGTDHGVEKIAHEVFGKAGFTILGTICENTNANEIAPEVNNIVFTGINWFGMARPAYREVVEAFNGENITFAGGDILRDMIQLALKLNLRVHNWDGPDGASTEAAKDYSAHAFSDAGQLLKRLGASGIELEGVPAPGRQAARWWTPEQLEWTMPKSFTAAGELDAACRAELGSFCAAINAGELAGALDQVRGALPKTLAALAASDKLDAELGTLVKALEKTQAQRQGKPVRSAAEREALAQRYNELAASISSSARSDAGTTLVAKPVDELAQTLARAAVSGQVASFSPMALMGAAALSAKR